MADILKLIPHILRWESGIPVKYGETLPQAYGRAKAKGVQHVKGDLGGATLCGVTLDTYTEYRRRNGKPKPTERDLASLEYDEWLDLLKTLFWNPCKADEISDGRVALMLVDWRWVNGQQAVRDAQTAFSLVPDGIVGPKTLAALNSNDNVFARLKAARLRSYDRIVARNPSQKRFYNGWINRTESI